MKDFGEPQLRALEKISNSELISSIYPMIDNIEVHYVDGFDSIILRFILNDPDITEENMYQKGLDPHYLIEYHLGNLLPYLGIPRTTKIGFTLINPKGKSIKSFIPT